MRSPSLIAGCAVQEGFTDKEAPGYTRLSILSRGKIKESSRSGAKQGLKTYLSVFALAQKFIVRWTNHSLEALSGLSDTLKTKRH